MGNAERHLGCLSMGRQRSSHALPMCVACWVSRNGCQSPRSCELRRGEGCEPAGMHNVGQAEGSNLLAYDRVATCCRLVHESSVHQLALHTHHHVGEGVGHAGVSEHHLRLVVRSLGGSRVGLEVLNQHLLPSTCAHKGVCVHWLIMVHTTGQPGGTLVWPLRAAATRCDSCSSGHLH